MNSKKLILVPFFTVLSFASLLAQNDLELLVKGSAEDATYLAKGYVTPALKAFGYGLNQGWYNTAKPHKLGGVDVTACVSIVHIPTIDKMYQVDGAKLNNLTLVSPTNGQVPTFFGPNTAPTYAYKSIPGSNFSGPPGVGQVAVGPLKLNIGSMPVPIAQLGIGLPKGFDLKVRYVPTLNFGKDGKFDMFGIGVMHDIKQYIPGIKNLPFDLSAFVGYTKMKLDVGLDSSKPDQHAIFDASATTIQGLISKKVAVLTVYAGLGYNIAKTSLALNGTYSFDSPPPAPPISAKDPVNFSVSSSGPRVTGGVRLKLAVITFHADYTIQAYNTLTAGFGINIR